jgi:hypothetical protein
VRVLRGLRPRLAAPLLVLTCASFGVLAIGPTAAGAVTPAATVSGHATTVASAPGTESVTYTITVSDAPIDSSVLSVSQPAALTPTTASVEVDGVAPAAGTMTASGADLVLRLGTGADASNGGQLAIGDHTVSFDAPVAALPAGDATGSATLDFGAAPATSVKSNNVALAAPDLTMTTPADSGEDQILPLGTGEEADFAAILTNTGGDTAAATLTIALPVGLEVDEEFGVYRDDDYHTDGSLDGDGDGDGSVELACHGTSGVVTCALGALAHGVDTLIDVPLVATPVGPVGQVGTFTVSARSDDGLDTNLADNSVHASVRFTGVAKLTVTLTTSTPKVAIGKTVKVKATVSNAGPQPAVDALGLLLIGDPDSDHFSIVGFSGAPISLPGGGELLTVPAKDQPTAARLVARVAARRAAGAQPAGVRTAAQARTLAADELPIVGWGIGTIAAGASVHAVLTLKAVSIGHTAVAAFAVSDAGDPSCDGSDGSDGSNCTSFATLALSAVAAVPSSSASTPAAGAPIANTAATKPAQLITAGLLAILAGALLLLAAGGWAGPSVRRHTAYGRPAKHRA